MITGRAFGFLIAAFILYLFGNQTQVGWLYVMSALMGGLVMVGWLIHRGTLKRMTGERDFDRDTFHETETIVVNVRIARAARLPIYQLSMVECCPLASAEIRDHRLYIPVITAAPLRYSYPVVLDRRGVYTFPAVQMRSAFPFGFFRRAARLDIRTNALVYPEVKQIIRFPLLDHQLAAERMSERAGHGGEVIGVRVFRSGDSPRHIHWRSTARAGHLMTREFANEHQPTLTLIVDTRYHRSIESKFNGFEYAIKCAVSIADYANRLHLPIMLRHGDERVPAPPGHIVWDAMLQVMARIQPAPTPLENLIGTTMHALHVVVIPQPHRSDDAALTALRARGISVSVVLIDNVPFGGDDEADRLYIALRAAQIDAVIIRPSEDYATQLSAVSPAITRKARLHAETDIS